MPVLKKALRRHGTAGPIHPLWRSAPYGASYATVLSTRSMHPARTALLQMYGTVQCSPFVKRRESHNFCIEDIIHPFPWPNEMEMTLNPLSLIIWRCIFHGLHCTTISFGQLYLSDRPRPGRRHLASDVTWKRCAVERHRQKSDDQSESNHGSMVESANI